MVPLEDTEMKKLTKPQQKHFSPILLAYLKQLGAKLEHLEEAALLIDDDADPDDGDEFGSEANRANYDMG